MSVATSPATRRPIFATWLHTSERRHPRLGRIGKSLPTFEDQYRQRAGRRGVGLAARKTFGQSLWNLALNKRWTG